MVSVFDVDLGQLGVHFPRDRVGMVVAQPDVSLTATEPFRTTEATKHRALQYIDNALAVALGRFHGAAKTHFTVFPEYSLPGLEGVERITQALTQENWPTETIVIGGVDGLSRAEFVELLQRGNTFYDDQANKLAEIREDQWVNCCITWAKLPSGEVRCWVQPKLVPAWAERNLNYQSMYEGRSILLFKGTYAGSNSIYQFATLLCFDWIGQKDNQKIWRWLLHGIDSAAARKQAALPLNWLFVAQCNSDPSHKSFMDQVAPFYDQNEFHSVNRAHSCLVMANVAGKPTPGPVKEFGRSAVIFTADRFVKPDCMPTYCNGGEPQRPGNPLARFNDAVFRERGACIHSFSVRNPETLPPGADGRNFALSEATVHPFDGVDDKRAPAGLVPAVVKWMNDELDDGTKSLAVRHDAVPLAGVADRAHRNSVATLRTLSPIALSNSVFTASSGTNQESTPDAWASQESGAVRHMLHTLSILDVAQYLPTLHGLGAQATIKQGDEHLEVVAVVGSSHDECDKHVMAKAIPHRGRLLIVSRDEDNTRWNPRMKRIFDQVQGESSEFSITDPNSGIVRVGYQTVLEAYSDAANEAELRSALDAVIV